MRTKEKQTRYTLEDCLYNQQKLRDLLKILIADNRPLTHKEKKDFYDYVPNALLSSGAVDPVNIVIGKGWFVFESLQTMAQRFAEIQTNNVLLRTTRPEPFEIKVSIAELWRIFYNKILYVYPQAAAEAIHISAESVERPQQGSYSFTSKEAL